MSFRNIAAAATLAAMASTPAFAADSFLVPIGEAGYQAPSPAPTVRASTPRVTPLAHTASAGLGTPIGEAGYAPSSESARVQAVHQSGQVPALTQTREMLFTGG